MFLSYEIAGIFGNIFHKKLVFYAKIQYKILDMSMGGF